ncbi:hydrogenase [Thermococcus sp. SY098]|uniref:hydrogenase n=1 Tax=Thermococcus sp. SY098 TaxID=3111325 RepID=UPI002D7963FD|nr:hydrogenase [Thermococcus sp. SY098]WRS53571.1 hydrogenase [Thermococcus sp. SY098]
MFGYWDALYFIYVLIIGLVISYILMKWGEKASMGTRRVGDGTKVYLSGEDEDEVIPQFEHLRGYFTGRHVMWGLIRGINRMFITFRREHTGLLTDYVAYLLVTVAIILGVLIIWG